MSVVVGILTQPWKLGTGSLQIFASWFQWQLIRMNYLSETELQSVGRCILWSSSTTEMNTRSASATCFSTSCITWVVGIMSAKILADNGIKDFVILDDRLKLNKVVREIQYTDHGISVKTEDGSVYMGKYVVSSVSLGVLQSDLIKFNPPLPCWKRKTFFNCDIRTYTKIFLKFPTKFWPTGDGT